MDLLQIAAEYIAAIQQIQVLSLRNKGHVDDVEVSHIVGKLPRFLDMPDELADEVRRIRLERYNLQ